MSKNFNFRWDVGCWVLEEISGFGVVLSVSGSKLPIKLLMTYYIRPLEMKSSAIMVVFC